MMKKNFKRNYTDLCKLKTFEERFEYLKLDGAVGESTFGVDRYLNQILYHSNEWKTTRDRIITRDLGCDLGVPMHEIFTSIYVHHMNAITIEDIENRNPEVFDEEFLICTRFSTHQAIHFGDENLLVKPLIERKPNDTAPWR